MATRNQKGADIGAVDERQIIAEEDLIIDAQFLIQEALDERGMTRAELAERTGISKARLSQIMRAEANPTLRTLAKLFYAMDDQLHLSRKEKMVVSSENRWTWAEHTLSAIPATSRKSPRGIDLWVDRGTVRFNQASNDDSPQLESNGHETATAA